MIAEAPQTPEAFAPAFVSAWSAGDADRLGALFVEDADFVNVVGLWWRQRKAIRKAHAYAFARYFRDAELALLEAKCRRLGDVAVAHARVGLTGQIAPDGSVAGPREAILTFTLSKTKAGWLAVSAQNTEVCPGMETQIASDGAPRPVAYPTRRG